MAAEIEEAFDSSPELIEGKGGVFVVTADGAVVFDKKAKGRFPKPGEVVASVRG